MNKTTVKSYAVILLIAFLLSVVACAPVPENADGESTTTNEIETEYSSETQTVFAGTSEVATETEAATETATVTVTTTETVTETVTETATETVTETVTETMTETETETETEETPEYDFSGLTYFAFGDSITVGADTSRQYAQMDNPYPKLVANSLGLQNYFNFALSGSTIATGVDDLPSIYNQCLNASAGADIISVMGGVNDYNRNVELGTIHDNSTTTFYGSLKAICKILLDKYPDAFTFFMTPYKEYCYHEFYCTEPNAAGYNLEDYAKAVEVVAALYNIPVLDMYNEGQFELEMYNENSDGIHPSQEFVTNYTAPQIVDFIKKNYKEPVKEEVPEVDFSKLTYLALGDSITFGADSTTGGQVAEPYPLLVANALGFSSYINRGYSGATFCRNDYNRVCMGDCIPLYADKADVISLMLGINDYCVSLPLGSKGDTTPDTVYGSLYTIASFLRNSQPDAFIFFMTPYKCIQQSSTCLDKNSAGYTLPDLVEAIKSIASDFDIPVLDLFNEGKFELEMFDSTSDGLHPSQEFFKEYTAPMIVDFIKKNCGEPVKEEIPEVDLSGLHYVTFGDSITYGELPYVGYAMENPYVKIVSEALNFASYTNFARGGATLNDTTNMPQWRPCMTNTILSFTERADIISVMLGVNDYTYPLPLGQMGDKTTASAYGSLYLIAEHLTTTQPDAFIFFMTPYKCVYGDMVYTEKNALGYCLEDYANAVKEVAAQFGIPVLDMFTEGQFELEMYSEGSDGVHPSQEFVINYTAPMIVEFIKENYKQARKTK